MDAKELLGRLRRLNLVALDRDDARDDLLEEVLADALAEAKSKGEEYVMRLTLTTWGRPQGDDRKEE